MKSFYVTLDSSLSYFAQFSELWSYFLLLQNNRYAMAGPDLNAISVSWSLAIEFQFYLLVALLIWGLKVVLPPERFEAGQCSRCWELSYWQ
jgi:peptidoglycan/LPS O-acetylase OafA/YrhL